MCKRSKSAKMFRIVFIMLFALIVCLQPGETVLAGKTVDSNRVGSVTIRYFDDVDARTPVSGAQFTFYKIDDSLDTTTYTDTTDFDGILKITNMKLGKYRVVETSPAYGHKASASFLLTLPMTENNEWIYDVTVEPKASYDLQTTSKSVYNLSGSAGSGSISTGSLSQSSRSYDTSLGLAGRNSSGSSNYADLSRTDKPASGQTDYAVRRPSVNTSDEANIGLWLVLCVISAVFLFIVKRGKQIYIFSASEGTRPIR